MMAMALASINNKTPGGFFGNPTTDGFFGVCVFKFRTKGLRTTQEFHVTGLSKDVQRDEGILPMLLVFFVLFFSCAMCNLVENQVLVDNSRNCLMF